MPVNIGQTEIAARMAEDELFVVKPEQPQNRCVQITQTNTSYERLANRPRAAATARATGIAGKAMMAGHATSAIR